MIKGISGVGVWIIAVVCGFAGLLNAGLPAGALKDGAGEAVAVCRGSGVPAWGQEVESAKGTGGSATRTPEAMQRTADERVRTPKGDDGNPGPVPPGEPEPVPTPAPCPELPEGFHAGNEPVPGCPLEIPEGGRRDGAALT